MLCFISEAERRLYFLPPKSSPQSVWSGGNGPVLSVSDEAALIDLQSAKHVSLVNISAAFGRRAGISAQQADGVLISNCSVFAVGRDGIQLNGSTSVIEDSTVSHSGCGGILTTGGDGRTLRLITRTGRDMNGGGVGEAAAATRPGANLC